MMAKTPIRTEPTVWECWTYDVWGNAKDGYEVNDRSCFDRACELPLVIETCNPGTPHAFETAAPTDTQIRVVFGVRCRLDTDGDDMTIYVNRDRDGYPIGEMHCTSHDSLSPIRKAKASAGCEDIDHSDSDEAEADYSRDHRGTEGDRHD